MTARPADQFGAAKAQLEAAARAVRPAPTVTIVLADLVREHADVLHQLAGKLRAFQPGDTLPPHRLLALAGQLLAQLADVERSVHHLAGWLPPAPTA